MKNKVLILGLAASIMSVSEAKAENAPCGEDCTWTFDENTKVLTIYGTGEISSKPWYQYKGRAIQTVVFAEDSNITSFGPYTFKGLINLTSITIPNSVTSIGESAFEDTNSLTSLTIPNSVTSIGRAAFYNAEGLTSITIPGSVTTIERQAFQYADNLTSVTIEPGGLTAIPDNAFNRCPSLTSVTIPEGVTSIGVTAFEMTPLTSITLPESLTTIGSNAFSNISTLSNLVIPSGVTNIDFGAFQNVTATIYCPGSATSSPCTSSAMSNFPGTRQFYTKDDDGVYSTVVDGVTYYYSSADKMVTGGVEAGCTSQESCAAVVAAALTAGSSNQGTSGGTGGSQGAHSGKRIYTVEEARAAVEAAGTDTVNFRIRYK